MMIVCIPDLLTRAAVRELREAVAETGFVDGAASAGYRARRVKHNLQMEKETAAAGAAKQRVLRALWENAMVRDATLPRDIQTPLINRYEPGMEYGWHVDNALMGGAHGRRTDASVTVFISDPREYDGGELLIQNAGGDEQAIKLPAGAAVVYPSGALHRVAPVTRGERLVAVTWIESHVRDAAQRELLRELNAVCKAMHRLDADAHETDLAHKAYANLTRMWADT